MSRAEPPTGVTASVSYGTHVHALRHRASHRPATCVTACLGHASASWQDGMTPGCRRFVPQLRPLTIRSLLYDLSGAAHYDPLIPPLRIGTVHPLIFLSCHSPIVSEPPSSLFFLS